MRSFKSVESQVEAFLSQQNELLKFDYIFTVLSRYIEPLSVSDTENASSLLAHLYRSPGARLRAVEMWIMFPEISPFDGVDADAILHDLWDEATRDCDERNASFAERFPGKAKIEARYAPYFAGIRKIFFPPKVAVTPNEEVERLKHLLDLKNQQIASLKMVIDAKDRLLELQKRELEALPCSVTQSPTSSS